MSVPAPGHETRDAEQRCGPLGVGPGAARPRRAREPVEGTLILTNVDNTAFCFVFFFFSFHSRCLISQRSADLVHLDSKRLPTCASESEIGRLLVVCGVFGRDVAFQKRIRDGAIEGHVHGLERHDDLGVTDDRVRQCECEDDLDSERRDVAVCSDVVHRVQQPEVAVHGSGGWFGGTVGPGASSRRSC